MHMVFPRLASLLADRLPAEIPAGVWQRTKMLLEYMAQKYGARIDVQVLEPSTGLHEFLAEAGK